MKDRITTTGNSDRIGGLRIIINNNNNFSLK